MKNIIKRIIVGFSIGVLLFLFKSYYVAAETKSIADISNLRFRIYKGQTGTGTLMYDNRNASYSNQYISFPANSNPNGQFMSFYVQMGTDDYTGNLTIDESFIITLQMCSSSNVVVWDRYAGLRDITKTKSAEILFGYSNDNQTCQVAGVNGYIQTYFIKYTTQSWNVEGDTAFQNKFFMYQYNAWGSAVNINVQNAMIQLATDNAVSNINQLKMMHENGATSRELNQKFSQMITQNTITQNILNNIQSGQQAQTDAQNETNEFLKDTSMPNNSDYDFSGFNANNGTITNLLSMPITLIQKMINGLNGSCSAYNFGSIKGQNISLPCIQPSNYLGAAWNIIDIIMSGVFIFIFGKKCIVIFNDFTNLRSNQVSEVFK